MLIEFDKSILDRSENFNKFSLLYNLCYLGRRYDFFIDVAYVKGSPLYEHLTVADKEIINDYFLRQVQESSIIDVLVMDKPEGEDYQLSIDEAIAYLNQPVCLILENSQNDKHFFESIVRNFHKKSKKIATHLQHNWLVYGNAGGCTNVKAFVNQKIESFPGKPKPGWYYIRCFVLLDSDSRYPGEIKDDRRELAEFLEKNNVPYHFLFKREMENYLPDEAFALASGSELFKQTYLGLRPLQKDYMDIEFGIIAADLDNTGSPVGMVYSDMSDAERNNIRNKGLNMKKYKSDFPLLFKSDLVTQASLLARTAHQGELADEHSQLLDKINAII